MLDRLRRLQRRRSPTEPDVPGQVESGAPRPVVYLPTWVEWGSMKQRPQFILETFARAGHPVYFVDPRAAEVTEIDGVHIVRDLGDAPTSHVILYVHFAPMAELFDRFEDPVVVYDILDDLSIYDADEAEVPEERRVRFHHPNVMQSADVVIVSNEILAERHRHERPDLVHVPNGVDVERFSRPAPRPTDVPVGGPIVGYHGMISHWFDFDLFIETATARPEWRFVLVGPTDPRVEGLAQEAEMIPNVTRLGERSSELMPAYVHSFDVGTIWFQINEMTLGVTPLKMFEYLAAGVPCVSTPLPACVSQRGVDTASDPESFVDGIESALSATDEHRHHLQEIARSSDWTAVMAPAMTLLEEKSALRAP